MDVHDSTDSRARHARTKAILISVAAAVGGFLFGFDTAVINGAVDAIQGGFHLSSFLTGLAVARALPRSAAPARFARRAAGRRGGVGGPSYASRPFWPHAAGAPA